MRLKEAEVRRPSVNLTTPERFARILLGIAGAIAGTLAVAAADGTAIVILSVLLVAAGLDLLVTGALGHCPLYKKLGYVPPSLRGQA